MRWLKVTGVIGGALVITTLGISASDLLSGSSGSLLGQLAGSEAAGPCPTGMVHVPTGPSFTCVDVFEVSAGSACPTPVPKTGLQTQANLNELACLGATVSGAQPWTALTREQAQAVCMRSSKRLPTAAEWYFFAIGTPDDTTACNVSGNAVRATGESTCRSAVGVFDTIGNVWEWVSDDVIEGVYQGHALPPEGYVTQVTNDGVAVATEKNGNELFANDYFWSSPTGAYGILRGGYFSSGTDGGLYTVQAKTPPTLATGAIGFRCVR